jgi:phospholipid/cholesterol/gamma-HCH transport system substrate-binding protein
MTHALRKGWRPFTALLGLVAVAAAVGAVILEGQRFTAPGWLPGVDEPFVRYEAELPNAQALTPGQGQTVDVAGVRVGEIERVELEEGRAIVTMAVDRDAAPVFRDASILVRPRTGLNDMTLQLDPGTPAAGRLVPGRGRIPIARTLPGVQPDEVLSALDGDTREYLQLLLAGGAQGLEGNDRALSQAFRRFAPTARDARRVTEALAQRRRNVARSITSFRRLAEALGAQDRDLTQLVRAGDRVFASLGRQDANVRRGLGLLPGTLRTTRTALRRTTELTRALAPASQRLRPVVRELAPALRATRPFARDTEPAIRTQLRPFARDVRPVVRELRPTAATLGRATPALLTSLRELNGIVNTLAFNPQGTEEGYLFWLSWANHIGASLFTAQDAHGPVRRGVLMAGCSGLTTLDQLKKANAQLGILIELSNFVSTEEACGLPQGVLGK